MKENKDEIIIPESKKDYKIKDLYEPVGLKLVQDKNGEHFKFYFPPQYVSKDREQTLFAYKDEIFNLLRVIDKLGENENFNESGNKSFLPLYSCLWIINDYLRNGTYKEIEKFYSTDITGKISWKNTIKKVMPYVIENKLVYSKFNVERIRQVDNDFFVRIQSYCFKFAINVVGWYFGIEPQKHIKLDEKTIKFYINYLQKKLEETFLDYKKFLIRYMISILENSHESTSLFSSVFTDSFHTVFENLVVNVFSNVNNLKDFYPTSKWYIGDDKDGKKDSNLRPDAIYVDKDAKIVFIVDAKYYNYGYQKNSEDISGLPSTADVSKQIRYAEDFKSKLKKKFKVYDINNTSYYIDDTYDIYNIFVLPYAKADSKMESNIKYIGYNKMDMNATDISETKDSSSSGNSSIREDLYLKVHAVMVDLKTLVTAHINNSVKSELIKRMKCFSCKCELKEQCS